MILSWLKAQASSTVAVAIGLLLLSLIGYVGYLLVEVADAKAETAHKVAELADARAAYAERIATAERARSAALERNREADAALAKQIQEASDARKTYLVDTKRMADGFSAERRVMRDQLAAYAAASDPTGGGLGSGDPVAACRERASTLGDALAGSLQAEEDLTDAIERCGADTRSLLDAWPVVRSKR